MGLMLQVEELCSWIKHEFNFKRFKIRMGKLETNDNICLVANFSESLVTRPSDYRRRT
jgi:hypothetical protein